MASNIKHGTCVRTIFSKSYYLNASVEPFGPSIFVGPDVQVIIKFTHVGSQFYTFGCTLKSVRSNEFVGNYTFELSVCQRDSKPKSLFVKSREAQKFKPNGSFTIGLRKLCLDYFSDQTDTLEMIFQFDLEEVRAPDVKEIPSSDSASNWFDKISSLYKEDNFKDLKLKIGNDILLVHRLVLIAHSKVFRAMLQHDTKERREGVIEIKDSDVDSFKAFLKYCYTDEFEDVKNNAVDLLILADKYDVQCLKKKCEDHLCGITEKDNAISHLIAAHLSNSTLLKATALIKIKPSAKEILQSEEASLLIAYPSLFREITLMYEAQS